MHFNLFSTPALILATLTFFLQVGCENNVFDTLPNEKCANANLTQNVSGEFTNDGTCLYKENIFTGKVNILFVVDNSKSMSAEHAKMADKFPGFINSLWNYDFRIAISTTDITSEPVRSGGFVLLSNGSEILSNQTGMSQTEISSIFHDSIRRQETIDCEISQNNCPSGDVRGIFATNLAVDKNNPEFFREGTHTAVVILSDADERVFGGTYGANFPLDLDWDTPLSLSNRLAKLGSGKTMSVHSIIINPGDEGLDEYSHIYPKQAKDVQCLNEQTDSSQGIYGYYGRQYYALSNPSAELLSGGQLLAGTVGSICSNNYGNVLSDIEKNIEGNTKVRTLRCEPLNLDVYVTDQPDQKIPFTFIGATQIKIDESVSSDVRITIETECNNVH